MIRELIGSTSGFLAGKDDWYLAVWKMHAEGDLFVAEGWHDVKGGALKGEFDPNTLTASLRLTSADSGYSSCLVPLPAKLYGAWIGNRLIGTWHTTSEASQSDGGRFEIWSESVRVSLAANVALGGPAARDMTWSKYSDYRDQGVFSLDDESGLWRGGYEDKTGKALEDLQLLFIDGLIRGRGRDKDGDFLVMGSYHVHSSSVHWLKHYTHPHRKFEYRGWWRGGRIRGTWAMIGDPDYSGPFEIEPHIEPEKTSLWFA